MGLAQISRGLLIAFVFGLLFTFWVNPGTTGGLLLLMAISTGVMYLLVSVAHLIWILVSRSRRSAEPPQSATEVPKAQSGAGITFRSQRGDGKSTDDGRSG